MPTSGNGNILANSNDLYVNAGSNYPCDKCRLKRVMSFATLYD